VADWSNCGIPASKGGPFCDVCETMLMAVEALIISRTFPPITLLPVLNASPPTLCQERRR
jgi:hypothetical protein